VFKAQCDDGGGGDTMVLEDALLLDPVPVLGWYDEDDRLDCVLEVRCEILLAKIWVHIYCIFLFLESFVIGFTNEFRRLLSKNINYKADEKQARSWAVYFRFLGFWPSPPAPDASRGRQREPNQTNLRF
jgi:hypothetical protein